MKVDSVSKVQIFLRCPEGRHLGDRIFRSAYWVTVSDSLVLVL